MSYATRILEALYELYTKEKVASNLVRDDKWLVRGLLAIYKLQTEFEKANNTTYDHNGVGFNGVDADFCSSLAKQVLNGRILSEKQMNYLRKIMQKYSGQLAKIANGKIQVPYIDERKLAPIYQRATSVSQ